MKTIFVDIDGTLVRHLGNLSYQLDTSKYPPLLPGTIDKFNDWASKGYTVILITGRRESSRKVTEDMLAYYRISYDQLIMGLPNGSRIIINDKKPNSSEPTAFAFSPIRNDGIADINI